MKVAKSKYGQDDSVSFECPGCKREHNLPINRWSFNGDYEKPTLSPSILATGKEWPTDEECDRILNGEEVELKKIVCHSFVTDGKIQFLGDCTHDMKNTTVELKDLVS